MENIYFKHPEYNISTNEDSTDKDIVDFVDKLSDNQLKVHVDIEFASNEQVGVPEENIYNNAVL